MKRNKAKVTRRGSRFIGLPPGTVVEYDDVILRSPNYGFVADRVYFKGYVVGRIFSLHGDDAGLRRIR
jgi:hypothetical protein